MYSIWVLLNPVSVGRVEFSRATSVENLGALSPGGTCFRFVATILRHCCRTAQAAGLL